MAVQWRISRWRGQVKVTRAQHWFWGHCGGDLEDGVNVVMVVKMVILGVVVMVVIVVVIKAGHCSCGRCGDGGGLGIGHGGQGGGRGHRSPLSIKLTIVPEISGKMMIVPMWCAFATLYPYFILLAHIKNSASSDSGVQNLHCCFEYFQSSK